MHNETRQIPQRIQPLQQMLATPPKTNQTQNPPLPPFHLHPPPLHPLPPPLNHLQVQIKRRPGPWPPNPRILQRIHTTPRQVLQTENPNQRL